MHIDETIARQRHMIALNNPIHLRILADMQSVQYRKRLLMWSNFLRLGYVALSMIFAPIMLQISENSSLYFIWQQGFENRTQILLIGACYILLISAITLINTSQKADERIFLANALCDAIFIALFMTTLNLTGNWNVLLLCFCGSILLSILTLNIMQCAVYAVFLYFELLLFYTLWRVFGDLSLPVMTPTTIFDQLNLTIAAILKGSPNIGNAAIMLAVLAMLIFLVGFLGNSARENKITADISRQFYKQSRLLNESIIAEMPAGLIVVNGKSELIAMNKRVRELFRLRDDEDLPYRLYNLSPMLARQLARWEDLKHNDTQTVKLFNETYSATFTPLPIENFAPLIMISLENVEISYQRVRETRLASLGRLTASIAHEIRNPLGSVQSANELINELAENQPQIQYLCGKINTNSKRMNAIISDILNMFRGGDGKHQLIILNDFLRASIASSKADNDLEHTPIMLEFEATTGYAIYFDPGHLSQILHNLMLNSIKHGGRNDIKIIIRTRLSGGGRNLYLDIMDNGQGIPPEDQERIFEPFFSKRQGTGLGLYLVREMCLANQAHISYVNTAPGACFRITMERYLPENNG